MKTSLRIIKLIIYKINIKIELLNFFWAILIVIIIRLVSTKVLIKMRHIGTTRIGHFAEDSANYFIDSSVKLKREINLFYFWPDSKHSNSFLKLLVRRNLKIMPRWFKYVDYWNRKIWGHEKYSIKPAKNRDTLGRFFNNNKKMNFLAHEDKDGNEFLKSIGWNGTDKIVLIHVRDSDFLTHDKANLHPTLRDIDPWSHHSYRDYDISTYSDAIRFLINDGFFVIRMGKKQKQKLNIQHENFLDYSFSELKSDFLDIWLFANADALISTVTGPCLISNIYGVPTLEINCLPSIDFRTFSRTLSAPKKLISIKTGKKISLKEHLESDFDTSNQYVEAGLDVVNLTSEEILKITKEFILRLNNKWVDNFNDKNNNKLFWDTLIQINKFELYHKWISPSAQISTEWLRINT